MHRQPEALRLVEDLNESATADASHTGQSALGITHLDSAVLLTAEKNDLLLLFKEVAVHISSDKTSANMPPIFNARFSYTYTAGLLKELRQIFYKAPKEAG